MITFRAVAGVGCLALVCLIFLHQKSCIMTPTGSAEAQALEREIRIGLPLGSSLSTVEDFLGKHRIEFSFEESSRSVNAIARKLETGTTLVSTSLKLRFYFDDASELKDLDAKVAYTGP